MYVCICKAVTEAAIQKAADNGAETIRDLKQELGLGSGCGKCVLQALQTLKAKQSEGIEAPTPVPAPVAALVEPKEITLERPRLRSALYG